MISLPIDDDVTFPTKVRRFRRMSRTMYLACLFGGPVLAILLLASGAGLLLVLVLPVLILYGFDARRATDSLQFAPVAPTRGTVAITADGIVVHHSTLAAPLMLAWSELRSFAVEPALTTRRRQRHRQFPIHRLSGIGHPLDEPPAFLDPHMSDVGALEVPLLVFGLGTRPPNVGLLLVDRRSVEVAAPPEASDVGWIPSVAVGGGRSLAQATAHLARAIRTLDPPGVYLRILEPAPLRLALLEHGVREGFDCTDWVHATGAEHQDL